MDRRIRHPFLAVDKPIPGIILPSRAKPAQTGLRDQTTILILCFLLASQSPLG
jgi:hypothetical protein